ncbi:MAG: 1,4-alpha-glucan branching protein GlgB [Clostridia bacterium]|nr:1,4-alpha-glucan branching protein GlgB [Clostridia bacterium]
MNITDTLKVRNFSSEKNTSMNLDRDYAIHLFHEGTARRAYDFLGPHFSEKDGEKGCFFRTWAPEAKEVYVIGDFNHWTRSHAMHRISDKGLWESFVVGAIEYQTYKYEIVTDKGHALLKVDPYGFHSVTRPETGTKLFNIDRYQWHDENWVRKSLYENPMSIYEVHLGSWRRYADGNYFNYRKSADELIPYVKEMGFTHIELLPISEYPYDASWGYQVLGYYSPTSRYGSPEDFMYLVDQAHQAGIGVILDWVPGHFPKDVAGLYRFDGHSCYEYKDSKKSEHKEWGTMIFDWGKTEVQSFLVSNAYFWIDKYHIDGLRVDAVASMIYLDYDRKDDEWEPNSFGGRENLEATAFLKKLNSAILSDYPDIVMIAEESTAWPMVTLPPYVGGLGFNFKWNMGFMNDTTEYMKTDPYFRQYSHNKLTFSMNYAFSENYILPLSHDEVVHMKGSLITKMSGNYEQKFENLKTYLGYMWTHPGKKLLFMGGEFAQFNEWHFEGELDWNLLEYPMHRAYQSYFKALNYFYVENAPLWEIENSWDGFNWLEAGDCENNVVVYLRRDKLGNELICVCNFSAEERRAYRFGISKKGPYKTLFQSNLEEYGGKGSPIRGIRADKQESHGKEYSVCLTIPPLTFLVLSCCS